MSDVNRDIGYKVSIQKVSANSNSTPTPIVPAVTRLGLVLFNEGPANLRIGVSGTMSNGIFFPSGTYFRDDLSDDDWFAVTVGNGSGTVSGYFVEG